MNLFKIRDFERGILSDLDQVNIPANGLYDLQNMRIMPGMLKAYYPSKSILTNSFTDLKTFAEFNITKIATIKDRFLIIQDGTDIKKSEYSSGYAVPTTIKSSIFSDKALIKAIKNHVYIIPLGLDYTNPFYWHGYINRNYFNLAQSQDGWYTEQGSLIVPIAPTLNLTGSGSLSGKYFIRLTYEFDNYQEGSWQEWGGSSQASISTSSEEHVEIPIELDWSTLNKRITAINIYAAWNSDTAATSPSTGWYLAGRVDINDSNWALVSGTTYKITPFIGLTDGGSSSNFPNDHLSGGFDDQLNEFTEELYTRTNAVIDKAYWHVDTYGNAIYMNDRLFVINPGIDYGEDLPYDVRQVVLFSQVGKPEQIHYLVDYINLTTEEGDSVVGLAEVNNNLLVLKENSLFFINMFNTGNSLDWQVNDPIKGIGCIAKRSVVSAHGGVFFAGNQHIYMTNGQTFKAITENKIQQKYLDLLNAESDYDSISAVFDMEKNCYIINFPTSAQALLYYPNYDRWETSDFGQDVDYIPIEIKQSVEGVTLGGSDAQIMRIFSSDATIKEYNTIETGWLDLDTDPFENKIISWIKIILENTGYNVTLSIYKNYNSSASKTITINSSTENMIYEEISLMGKVFKIKIETTSDKDNLFKLKEILIGFKRMGER